MHRREFVTPFLLVDVKVLLSLISRSTCNTLSEIRRQIQIDLNTLCEVEQLQLVLITDFNL